METYVLGKRQYRLQEGQESLPLLKLGKNLRAARLHESPTMHQMASANDGERPQVWCDRQFM